MRTIDPKAIRGKILPACALLAAMVGASQAQGVPAGSSQPVEQPKPKIQVNFLNPCRPAPADAGEIGRALALAKENPKFSSDFEIARGVTTLTEAEARATGSRAEGGRSSWVRIRHEFPDKAPLSDAQYSVSSEGDSAGEALALHLRESKQVLQITISNSVSGTPAQLLQTNTPPDRIRIERYGKPSLVLARCAGMEQSNYEPIFQTAADILQRYRAAMAIQTLVPAELARLPGSGGKVAGAAGGHH